MLTIELFGVSRTGKTSTLRKLVSRLEQQGETCAIVSRAPLAFKDCKGLEDFHDQMFRYMETSLQEHTATRPNYIVMDRGPYDREIMLEADHADGQVSSGFYRGMIERIESLQQSIDLPLLFMIDPRTSLARIPTQIDEGLAYVQMCEGLNTRDNTNELQRLHDRYSRLQQIKPAISLIDTSGTADNSVESVLREIKLKTTGA